MINSAKHAVPLPICCSLKTEYRPTAYFSNRLNINDKTPQIRTYWGCTLFESSFNRFSCSRSGFTAFCMSFTTQVLHSIPIYWYNGVFCPVHYLHLLLKFVFKSCYRYLKVGLIPDNYRYMF